jgi:hypothetical protein
MFRTTTALIATAFALIILTSFGTGSQAAEKGHQKDLDALDGIDNVQAIQLDEAMVSSEGGNADVEVITAMLQTFLATADKAEAHERFWANDLVYTSSDGTRTSKGEIMAGFAVGEEKESLGTTLYSGENIKVQLFGTTAIVIFKLVGTPSDGSEVLSYLNTGTFLKRNGVWRVVAWQATAIQGG